jgi:hypothetical protein
MTRRKPRNSLHGRRVIGGVRVAQSVIFSDLLWSRVAAELPPSSHDVSRLREVVTASCDEFLSNARTAKKGGASVDAITRGGGKQPAPLERLISQLNSARETWAEISDIHDDRLGVLSDLDALLAAAIADGERRLALLRSSERTAISIKSPFIRALADCLRKFGFKPTTTGQIYGATEPTWFQKFVRALNDHLLGENGWGAAGAYSERSLYADVAKAMTGYRKPG